MRALATSVLLVLASTFTSLAAKLGKGYLFSCVEFD